MKIGVLLGGRSPEREISIKTGANVAAGLEKAGYEVVKIDACQNVAEDIKKHNIDLAFIALHGPLGEDGTIQGLLEFLDIPYTGAGVMGSSMGMNKVMTKILLEYHNIPTPAYYFFQSSLLKKEGGKEEIKALAEKAGVNLPVIVKPSVGGSTIGTNIVHSEDELEAAYLDAAKYCHQILVEEFIQGTEITVGVLGSDDPFPLPVIEIIAVGGFYNYTTKYQPGMSDHIIPARIPEDLYKKSQELAVKTFIATDCYGMGRVDFMVRDNKLYCLEINTIPGMTETSLLPETAQKAGISFEELLKLQIKYALERHEKMKEVSQV